MEKTKIDHKGLYRLPWTLPDKKPGVRPFYLSEGKG